MSFFTTPDGVKLHYRTAGSGKSLLFLHGWSMCSRVWRYQIEWFAPKDVETDERMNLIVTYVTQKKVAWTRDPGDKIRELEQRIANLMEKPA